MCVVHLLSNSLSMESLLWSSIWWEFYKTNFLAEILVWHTNWSAWNCFIWQSLRKQIDYCVPIANFFLRYIPVLLKRWRTHCYRKLSIFAMKMQSVLRMQFLLGMIIIKYFGAFNVFHVSLDWPFIRPFILPFVHSFNFIHFFVCCKVNIWRGHGHVCMLYTRIHYTTVCSYPTKWTLLPKENLWVSLKERLQKIGVYQLTERPKRRKPLPQYWFW